MANSSTQLFKKKSYSYEIVLILDGNQVLLDDWEMQNWAEDLAKPKAEGGIGMEVSSPLLFSNVIREPGAQQD